MNEYEQQPPHLKEFALFRSVPMQEIAQLLQTFPTPITIKQYVDPTTEELYYGYQVGTPTGDRPFGLGTGATTDFLEAVRLSLGIAMGNVQEEPGAIGQIIETRPIDRQPLWMPDEWIVPEVERGEATSEQAAALGLLFRHRDTGETMTEWTERTLHTDAASQEAPMGEEDEAAITSVLRHLPIAVNISIRDMGYVWKVLEENGIAETFVASVENGLHSLLLQLIEHQQSTQVRYREFGDVLYSTLTEDGIFTERIVTETEAGRVVIWDINGRRKRFRVEWTEPDGWKANKVVDTLEEAMDAFQDVQRRRRLGEI